jgi:1-deoxy-D-xylulose-5-phosphate synthase
MIAAPNEQGQLLQHIHSPDDLKKLTTDQLPDLCFELRDYIISQVAVHGGHFGASLGTVELTTALHYSLNTPHDLLVWDVGHQAYGHKILTGRKDLFHTNRKYGGISGFPKRSESIFDTFGVGHSSTSISAALGMAKAAELSGEKKRVVAVIGDGAMTAGMAFEGLNNAGALHSDVLVILNDNCMSIDPNVGALKEYLTDITTSKTFNRVRDELYDLLGHFQKTGDRMRKAASKLEHALTTALTPGSLFRSLGFKYYGPIDGHNVRGLVKTLDDLRDIPGPKLLHVVTVKGKGFAPAERDPLKWHAQGSPFDKITGAPVGVVSTAKKSANYQDIFGSAIIELAKANDRIVGVTAAMPSGTGLNAMMSEIPDRAFDVGIAEQHAVTFAAGMATQGYHPFVAIYSTFLQRGYDQVVHDVCIQHLPVVFCMDRAGLVGADGPTHHGLYDIPYMRCLPNMVVSAPMDEQELRNLMYTASLHKDGPFSIRYPRGKGAGVDIGAFEQVPVGKSRVITQGQDVAVLSFGSIGNQVVLANRLMSAEGIHTTHVDMRFVKPLDTDMIDQIVQSHQSIITIEDGTVLGGFGSAVAEYIASKGWGGKVSMLGIPDTVIEHGTQEELWRDCGIDATAVVKAVHSSLNNIQKSVATP